ncbi:hypothetical protein ONZ45_g17490 [Pleurotus djamor]|nr:hypothetical protein ONZ45_g17490 [Pleurotus djamor]
MTPQEYQQILSLRKPLKALALCCISGSLSGAHALSNYLVDNPVERQEASQIIPAVLDTLLALDEVPNALDFGTFELVQTALLLLSAFSHLSLIAEEEAIAAGRFVKHEATIFSWLSFLQRHLFGPPAPNLLSLIEDARPDFLMVMILVTQTLTNYLHRPQPEIDFTRCEYITNTTFELWSLLQRTSYDDCHRTTMLVTNYTSGVVTAFIENSLNNQSHHFVDKIGGISSVVPLFLSAVDYYWNHTVSQLNRRVPPYAFASLEQLLCDALTLVNSHHFRDHVDIPSSVCYLTSAIHWVLKTRVHILERLPQDFNNGYLAPRTYIQSYVKFITTSLSHPRYYLTTSTEEKEARGNDGDHQHNNTRGGE